MSVSRNAPCPCGSGKKYKRCCLGKDQPASPQPGAYPSAAEILAAEISAIAKDHGVTSIEGYNQIAGAVSFERNHTAKDDFLGLSPDQMQQFLYSPFESNDLVSYPCITVPDADILGLYDMLNNELGDNGGKATSKGNLPLKLCQRILEQYESDTLFRPPRIRSEEDFEHLHCVRIVAQQAKLIRKYKGRFQVTRKGRELSSKDRRVELFLLLLKTYTTEFNWGYRDGYPQAEIIQTSFLFTIYLLLSCGENFRSSDFYEDLFLRAFPMVITEMGDNPYFSAEEQARHCYMLRAFDRFACFFGFAEIRISGQGLARTREFRQTPELAEVVRFNC